MSGIPTPSGLSGWGQFPAGSNWTRVSQRWKAIVGVGTAAATVAGLTLCTPHLAAQRAALEQTISQTLMGGSELAFSWLKNSSSSSSFAALSLNAGLGQVEEEVVEPKTGMTFPGVLNKCQLLTGTGLRTKSILGLKKITVYTFGNFLPLLSFTADVRILLCPVYLLHSFHIIF
jgi:hypothetical protein